MPQSKKMKDRDRYHSARAKEFVTRNPLGRPILPEAVEVRPLGRAQEPLNVAAVPALETGRIYADDVESASVRTDTDRSIYSARGADVGNLDPWQQYRGNNRATGEMYSLDYDAAAAVQESDSNDEERANAEPSAPQADLGEYSRHTASRTGPRRRSPREDPEPMSESTHRIEMSPRIRPPSAATRSNAHTGGGAITETASKEIVAKRLLWFRVFVGLNLIFSLIILSVGAAEMSRSLSSTKVSVHSSSNSAGEAQAESRRLQALRDLGLQGRRLQEMETKGGSKPKPRPKPKPKPKPTPGEKDDDKASEEEDREGGGSDAEREHPPPPPPNSGDGGSGDGGSGDGGSGGGGSGDSNEKEGSEDPGDRRGYKEGGPDSPVEDGYREDGEASSESEQSTEGQKRYDFYATTIAFHVALYAGYLWCLYDVLWQSSISLWQAAILTKVSVGWLFAAAAILLTEIALHLASNFTALYAVETVLNVLDILYFVGVLVVVAVTLWSLDSNSVAVEPSLSQSQKGTVAGASAPLSTSQHQAQLSPSVKPPPEPFPRQQAKESKGMTPSAPPLPKNTGEKVKAKGSPNAKVAPDMKV